MLIHILTFVTDDGRTARLEGAFTSHSAAKKAATAPDGAADGITWRTVGLVTTGTITSPWEHIGDRYVITAMGVQCGTIDTEQEI